MSLQQDSTFNQGFLKRLTAVVAILTFATTQVGLPHAGAQTPRFESTSVFKELSGHLDALKIPANIGKLEEVYQGSGNRLVVLIQDAHGIPEAQRNIRNLIDFFQHTYGIQMLTLEGASSRLNPQIFRSFPDKETLKHTFKEYLERGELTGTAMAAIFNEIQGTYEGVEDWALYEEGYGYFLECLKNQDVLVEKLDVLDKDLLRRQQQTYSPDLLKVDRALRDFHANLGGIVDLLRTLAGYQKPEKGSELDLLYEESLRDADSQIPAEVEAKRLGEQVKDYLASKPSPSAGDREMFSLFNEKFQAFKVSELSAQDFMLFLKDTAASFNLKLQFSRSMSQLMKRQKKMRDIEGTRFFESLEEYAAKVKSGLMQSELEKRLDQEKQEIDLLRNLVKLEVSRKQWNRFMTLASGENILLNSYPDLREDMNASVAFYMNAEKRDAAFVHNLQKVKAPGNAMIFVAGGFHTEGLIRRLKEEGASYALIMPEIGSLPDEVLYRDHIRGFVSWRDYFRVEQGKVDVYKAFVRATRDRLLAKSRDEGALLKEWRDQIIRDLADKNQISETSRHVRYLDEKMSEANPDGNQLMEKVERFIEGLKELQIRNQINEQSILKLLRPATIADLTSASLAESNLFGSTRRFQMGDRGLVPVDLSVPQEPVLTAAPVSVETPAAPLPAPMPVKTEMRVNNLDEFDTLMRDVNQQTEGINRILLYFGPDRAITLDLENPFQDLRNPQEWLRGQMPANRDLDALVPFTLELKQHDRVLQNGVESLLNVVILDFSRPEMRVSFGGNGLESVTLTPLEEKDRIWFQIYLAKLGSDPSKWPKTVKEYERNETGQYVETVTDVSTAKYKALFFERLIEAVIKHKREGDWTASDTERVFMNEGDSLEKALDEQRFFSNGAYREFRNNLFGEVPEFIKTELSIRTRDVALGLIREAESGKFKHRYSPSLLSQIAAFVGGEMYSVVVGVLFSFISRMVMKDVFFWTPFLLGMGVAHYLRQLVLRPLQLRVDFVTPIKTGLYRAPIYAAVMERNASQAASEEKAYHQGWRALREKIQSRNSGTDLAFEENYMLETLERFVRDAFGERPWVSRYPESRLKITQVLEVAQKMLEMDPGVSADAIALAVIHAVINTEDQLQEKDMVKNLVAKLSNPARGWNDFQWAGNRRLLRVIALDRQYGSNLMLETQRDSVINTELGLAGTPWRLIPWIGRLAESRIGLSGKKKAKEATMAQLFDLSAGEVTPADAKIMLEGYFWRHLYRLDNMEERSREGLPTVTNYKARVLQLSRIWRDFIEKLERSPAESGLVRTKEDFGFDDQGAGVLSRWVDMIDSRRQEIAAGFARQEWLDSLRSNAQPDPVLTIGQEEALISVVRSVEGAIRSADAASKDLLEENVLLNAPRLVELSKKYLTASAEERTAQLEAALADAMDRSQSKAAAETAEQSRITNAIPVGGGEARRGELRAQETTQEPFLFRVTGWMPLGRAARSVLQGLRNFSRSESAAGIAGLSLAGLTLVGGLWIASMLGGLGFIGVAAGAYGAVLFALNAVPFIAGQTGDQVLRRTAAKAGEFKAEDFQYSAKDFPQGLNSEDHRRVIIRINSAMKIASERMNIPQSFRNAGIADGSQVKAYVFRTSDQQIRVKFVAMVNRTVRSFELKLTRSEDNKWRADFVAYRDEARGKGVDRDYVSNALRAFGLHRLFPGLPRHATLTLKPLGRQGNSQLFQISAEYGGTRYVRRFGLQDGTENIEVLDAMAKSQPRPLERKQVRTFQYEDQERRAGLYFQPGVKKATGEKTAKVTPPAEKKETPVPATGKVALGISGRSQYQNALDTLLRNMNNGKVPSKQHVEIFEKAYQAYKADGKLDARQLQALQTQRRQVLMRISRASAYEKEKAAFDARFEEILVTLKSEKAVAALDQALGKLRNAAASYQEVLSGSTAADGRVRQEISDRETKVTEQLSRLSPVSSAPSAVPAGGKAELRAAENIAARYDDLEKAALYLPELLTSIRPEWESLRGELRVVADFELSVMDRVEVGDKGAVLHFLDGQVLDLPKIHRGTATGLVFTGRDDTGMVYALKVAVNPGVDRMVARGAYVTKTLNPAGGAANLSQLVWEGKVAKDGQTYYASLVKNPAGVELSRIREKISLEQSIDLFERWARLVSDTFKGRYGKAMALQDLKLDNVLVGARGMVIPIDPDGAMFRFAEDQPTVLDFENLPEDHPLRQKFTVWTEGLAYNRRTSPLASPQGSSLTRFFTRDPDFPLRQSAFYGYMTFYQLVKNIYPFIFRDGSADPLPDSLKTPAEKTAEREGKLPSPLVGNFTGARAMEFLFQDLGLSTPEGFEVPASLTEADIQSLIETILQIENLTVLDYEGRQDQEAWIEGKFDRFLELLGTLKEQAGKIRDAVQDTGFDLTEPASGERAAEVPGTLQTSRGEMREVTDSRIFSIGVLDFKVRLSGDSIQVISADGNTVLKSKKLKSGESLTVGRNPRNDLVVPSSKASRVHFMIQRQDNRYYLVDATSTNGTFIKGISGRITRVPLELEAPGAPVGQPEFVEDLGPKIPQGFGRRGTFKIGGIRNDAQRPGKQIRIVEDALINPGTPFRLANLTFRVRAMTEQEQLRGFAARRTDDNGENPLQTGEILPYVLEVYDSVTRIQDGQAVTSKEFIPLPHVYFTPQGSVFVGRTTHPETRVPKASEFPDDLGGVRPIDLEESRTHEQLEGQTRIAVYETSPERDGVLLPIRLTESVVSRHRTEPDEDTRVEDHRSDSPDYIPAEVSAYARPGHVEIAIADTDQGPMVHLTDRGSYNGTVIESTPQVRQEFLNMMDPSAIDESGLPAEEMKAGPGESTNGTFILAQGQAAEVVKGEPLVFHAKYPFRIRVEDQTGKARFIVTLQQRGGKFYVYDDFEHTMDRQPFAADQSQIQGRALPFTIEAKQIAGKMRAIIRLAENVNLGFVPKIIVTTLNERSRGEMRSDQEMQTLALKFGDMVKQRGLVDRLIQSGAEDSFRPSDGQRILFLTQAQFDKVGAGAVLVRRDGGFFVKGRDDASRLVAEQLFLMPKPVLPVGILLQVGRKTETPAPRSGIAPAQLGSLLAGEVASFLAGYIEQNLGRVSEEQMSVDQMAPFVENQIARRADAFSTSLYQELKALGVDALQEEALGEVKELVLFGLDFSDQELTALALDLEGLGINLESLPQQLVSYDGVSAMVDTVMSFVPGGGRLSLAVLLDMLKRLLLNIPDSIRFEQARQREAEQTQKTFPRASQNPNIEKNWRSYFEYFERSLIQGDSGLVALYEKNGRPNNWEEIELKAQDALSRFLKILLLDGGIGLIAMNADLRGRDLNELLRLPLEDLVAPGQKGDLYDLQSTILLDLRDYFDNNLARNELRMEGALPKEKTDPAAARQVSRMVVEILGRDQVPASEEIVKAAHSADLVLESFDVESFIRMLREEALKVQGVISTTEYTAAVNYLLDDVLKKFLDTRFPNQSFTLALDLESPSEAGGYAEGLGRISDHLGRLLVRGNLGDAGRDFRKVLGARLSPVSSLRGRQLMEAGQVVLPAITPGVFQEALEQGVFGVQLLNDAQETLDPRVESYAKLLQLVVGIMAAANLRDPSQTKLSGALLQAELVRNMSFIMDFQGGPLTISENGVSVSLSKISSMLTAEYISQRIAKASA